MAWTKMKTVVAVGVAALVVGVTTTVIMTDGGPDREYQGSLTVIFPMAPRGQPTNHFTFRLLSKPPDWELFLTSSNLNYEALSSPKQTFEVSLFTNNPPSGPLNTCEIIIIPGSQPHINLMTEDIWLALLSGDSYFNKRLPLPDSGLGAEEPILIYKMSAMEGDTSPRQMSWTNAFRMGRTNWFEGDFHWVTGTNIPTGFNFPTESQMTMYTVSPNGDRKGVNFSDIVVDRVTPLKENLVLVPKIPGRNVVFDYRLGKIKRYEVRDGEGLEDGTEAILRQQEQSTRLTSALRHRLESEQRFQRKWMWLSVTLIVCAIAVMAGLMKRCP